MSKSTKRRRKSRRGIPRIGATIPKTPLTAERLLVVNDLCALLHTTRQTVWALRKREDFPTAVILNEGGTPRWYRRDIEAWLETRRADRVSA